MTTMTTNNYAHWPPAIAAAFAAYDGVRHLEPADPCRMAAADRLWCAQHPDWTPVEVEVDPCPF